MNSRTPIDKKTPLKSAYGMKLFEQNEALTNLENILQTARFFTKGKNKKQEKNPKKALLTCQKGFLLSIRSFRALREHLKTTYGIHYVMGSRVNQDILESTFSSVRAFGSNTSPNPTEFRFRLRLLILGAKPRQSRGTNCQFEDANYLAAEIIRNLLPVMSQKKIVFTPPPVKSTFELLKIESFDSDAETLRYLAGYLAWKLKRKGKGIFGVPTACKTVSCGVSSWIQHLSFGGLLLPNDEIFNTVKNAEAVFVEVMKTHFLSEKISLILEEVMLAHYPTSNVLIVKEYIQCRLRIRLTQVKNHLSILKSQSISV